MSTLRTDFLSRLHFLFTLFSSVSIFFSSSSFALSSDEIADQILSQLKLQSVKTPIHSISCFDENDEGIIKRALISYLEQRQKRDHRFLPESLLHVPRDIDNFCLILPRDRSAPQVELVPRVINVDDYEVDSRLPQGVSGSVYAFTHREKKREYVFKTWRTIEEQLKNSRKAHAANLLNELLGLKLVPYVEVVQAEVLTGYWAGRVGTLQNRIPEDFLNFRQNRVEHDSDLLVPMKTFDYLANANDRHLGNMFSFGNEIRTIDYDEHFSPSSVIEIRSTYRYAPNHLPVWYSRSLAERILRFDFRFIELVFSSSLNATEIEGLWFRIMIMQTDMRMHPEKIRS